MNELASRIAIELGLARKSLSGCNPRQPQEEHCVRTVGSVKSVNIGLVWRLFLSLFLTNTVQLVASQPVSGFTPTSRSHRISWICRLLILPQLVISTTHAKPYQDNPLQFNCERTANRLPALHPNRTHYNPVQTVGEGPVTIFHLPHDLTQGQGGTPYGRFNGPASSLLGNMPVPVQRPGDLSTRAAVWSGQGLSPRKSSTYRPHLWTQLSLDNCYNPASSMQEVRADAKVHHSRGTRRQRHSPYRPAAESQDQHPRRAMPISVRPLDNRRHWSQRRTPSNQPSTQRSSGRRPKQRRRRNRQHRSTEKDPTPFPPFVQSPTEVITVDHLAIRPSVIRLKDGNVKGRLRYVVQLHRRLTGYFRLTVKVWLGEESLPVYVGIVKNICAHWPADRRQAACSLRKLRFYQSGRVCLCHMPPGEYQQRFRFNFPGILDDLHLPRFLVNLLFSGKNLNLVVEAKIEEDNDRLVGCVRVKIPVVLESL